MTTSDPTLAREIAAAAKAKGVYSVDAPGFGRRRRCPRSQVVDHARRRDAEVVDALMPCWETMGKTIVHQGGPGAGQHTKMVNQILIASNMIGVCEALLYGYRAGLDLETVMKSVASGAAGSWSLSNLGPRIIGGNFDPGFFVEHFIKDMGIALEESKRMGLCHARLGAGASSSTSRCPRRGTAGPERTLWNWCLPRWPASIGRIGRSEPA